MKIHKIASLIFLILCISACTDRFDDLYASSSVARQRLLSHTKDSIDLSELSGIDTEGICIIGYVSDLRFLPIVSGIQLTEKEIYSPPGDQYINLLFWNKREWRQVLFNSSELQISHDIVKTMTYYNYCRKGEKINLIRTPFRGSTFTTIVTIEG